VVSNLGVFDFATPDGSMRLVSAHPGVGIDEIIAATGFRLGGLDEAGVTPEPDDDQMALIEQLDPRGARLKEIPA
jgi:acyl CoA:acetate/3-ketoacid CoA transferase beta subunit